MIPWEHDCKTCLYNTEPKSKACEECRRDLVEVVRCKDCKRAEFSEAGMTYCPEIIGSWVEDDWFCADGERREDG